MSSDNQLRILFVEDLPSDVDLAVLELRKEKLFFKYITVCTSDDLKDALNNFKPDLVISDYMMPTYTGMEALIDVKKFDDKIPFILFPGSINEETAVKCIKAGADGYVIKEHITRLPFAVKEALEQFRIKTEKMASDLLLRDIEEKLQSIYKSAPIGIGLLVNSTFIEVNDAFCRITGYERNELIGQSARIIYPSISEFDYVGKVYQQIVGDGTVSLETKIKSKKGVVLDVIFNFTPLDKSDHSKGFSFSLLDITSRKQNEDAIKTSLSILNASLDSTADGILVVDGKGSIVRWNQKFAQMWDLPDEILKMNDDNAAIESILCKLKDPDIFVATVEDLYQNPEKLSLDKIEFRDGRIFERYSQPQKIDNVVVGRVWSFRDITEQRKLQEATLASEQRYRDLFMNNPFPTYIFDAESLEFIEVNDATVNNYGYSREEFATMTIKDLRLPEDIPALIETVRNLGDKPAHSTNMRHRRKDGTVFPIENSSYILPEKNGRRTRLSMTLDITERLKAAEQMNLAKDKAEASDRLKTTFLNNISHEVRTPLNGILGFAEIISQTNLSEEEKTESISMLHESCDRLLTTITSYMDISLLTSGSLSLHKKDFFPERLLRRIFDIYEKTCSEKNLKIVLEIPEKSNNFLINSDPEIFQKIFIHLLNNAVKFTFKGSINFGYTIQNGNLEFFVKDTGIGIGKDAVSSIFDHFVKEDRGPSKLSEGSGLGLSIAKGMIGLLGGTIRVVSEIEVGTSFYFTITYTEPPEKSSSDTLVDEPGKVKIRATILIAEDDEANFFYLNAVLKRETDATILHASNGIEAIELFRSNHDIALILMDIKMPIMDGFEATKQIKMLNKDIPIVAVTAYAMLGDEKRVFDAGCDGYLSKPINRKILVEKVAEFIKV